MSSGHDRGVPATPPPPRGSKSATTPTRKIDATGNEKGVFLILSALMLPVLFGFLALATDLGFLYHQRRLAQTAADAGALYGGQQIRRGAKTFSEVEGAVFLGAGQNHFTNGADGVEVTVEYPATSVYPDNAKFAALSVAVTICKDEPTFFMHVLGVAGAGVCAYAAAGYTDASEGCIFALNPTDEKSLYVSSVSGLRPDCGLIVNSTNTGGLYVHSDGCVDATEISLTATDYHDSSTCSDPDLNSLGFTVPVDPLPVTEVTPVPDPLGHLLPPPEVALPCYLGADGWNVDSPAKVALLAPNQKYCKGLKIDCPVSVCGVINLSPGNYVIAGERLESWGRRPKSPGQG